MPKQGYTSLTIGDVVYDTWFDFYQRRKKNFKKQGINSMASLISAILDAVFNMNGPRLTELVQMEVDRIE